MVQTFFNLNENKYFIKYKILLGIFPKRKNFKLNIR